MIKSVLALLCLLVPYERDSYRHWSDFDSNGLDTRAEVLLEESLCPVVRDGDRVVAGCWIGAYSGRMFYKAREVHVDHVVALYEAHRLGACFFSPKQKEQLANDRENLVLAEAGLNISKGARGPSEWLPPKDRVRWYLWKRERVRGKYALR